MHERRCQYRLLLKAQHTTHNTQHLSLNTQHNGCLFLRPVVYHQHFIKVGAQNFSKCFMIRVG